MEESITENIVLVLCTVMGGGGAWGGGAPKMIDNAKMHLDIPDKKETHTVRFVKLQPIKNWG